MIHKTEIGSITSSSVSCEVIIIHNVMLGFNNLEYYSVFQQVVNLRFDF